MSLRRFRVLVEHLPAESHTIRALSGRPRQDWTITEHLLAGVYDQVQFNTYVTGAVGNSKKNPVGKPKPLTRPDMDEPAQPRRQSSGTEIAAFFAGPGTAAA